MKVGPNPFLPPHLPEINEMTEFIGEEEIDNMNQEELDEIHNQMDLELQAEFQEEPPDETQ